jgi:acyl phosphate:glycerol-3-phosphate acyltransferase
MGLHRQPAPHRAEAQIIVSPYVGVAAGYLAGSIPSAYIAGSAKGIDLRMHGSGNLGATNVVRVLGARIGAAVFAVDIMKGFLPVFLFGPYMPPDHRELWLIAIGVAAILGHVKPIFLFGKGGGKGVATAAGVFLALAWAPTLVAFVAWIVIFAATRYVSAASLVASATLPVALYLWIQDPRHPYFVLGFLVAVFVFFTHRANIGRLRRGEEHRFVRRPPGAGAEGRG